MFRVKEYSVEIDKHNWSIVLESNEDIAVDPNSNFKNYIGYRNDKDNWIIFKIKRKTTIVKDPSAANYVSNTYLYFAEYVGYHRYAEYTKKLENVKFEWITDGEIIKEAIRESGYL